MTKLEMYSTLIAFLDRNDHLIAEVGDEQAAEIVEKLTAEKARLETRANTPRKPTARQEENKTLKTDILEYLTAADKPVSIAEIQNSVPSVSDLTNQRITHLLTALVNADAIIKTYEKKSPRYTIAQ